MSKKENIYIKILKYATEKKEFTESELLSDLKLNQDEKNFVLNEVFRKSDLLCNTGRCIIREDGGFMNIWTISVEGMFKLLKYKELEEARKSSKQAMRFAIAALIVSSILAFFSIIIQIFCPMSLDAEQFNKLIELITIK